MAKGRVQTVEDRMKVEGYSRRTIKTYLRELRKFVEYIRPHHPRHLGANDIRAYLLYIIAHDKAYHCQTPPTFANTEGRLASDVATFSHVPSANANGPLRPCLRPSSRGSLRDRIDDSRPQSLGGKRQCCLNSHPGQPRMGIKNLFNGFPCSELLQDELDSNPRTSDDRFAHHHCRIRDNQNFLHFYSPMNGQVA